MTEGAGRVRTRSSALALVVALAVLIGAPVGLAPAATPLAHREVLPNGIVLLVAERPAVPIVAVRAFTRAGAVVEPPDRVGLANLMGGLLTRGTARRTGPEIDAAIEFVGGSLESGAGRDGLYVSLAVLAKDLPLGLDLMAEVLLSPTFPEDEFRRRVSQVQAAIRRSQQSPSTVGGRALARLVYGAHPYATPVEGTEESVARLTREDVLIVAARQAVQAAPTAPSTPVAATPPAPAVPASPTFDGTPPPVTPAPVAPAAPSSDATPPSVAFMPDSPVEESRYAVPLLLRASHCNIPGDRKPRSMTGRLNAGESTSMSARKRNRRAATVSVEPPVWRSAATHW